MYVKPYNNITDTIVFGSKVYINNKIEIVNIGLIPHGEGTCITPVDNKARNENSELTH